MNYCGFEMQQHQLL